jgi:hypothetical protein
MTGATRRGGQNGTVARPARPTAAKNTLALARAAAHDLATFRTILDLQSESVSALLDGQRMPPDVAEKLRRILRTARAASGTAAHFIQLARDAEAAGRRRPNGAREITVGGVLAEVEARFSHRAEERGIRLVFEPAPELVLHGTGEAVRWALRTLLETAVELTSRPELRISCVLESPTTLALRVSESGEAPANDDATSFSMGLGLLREALRAAGGSLETTFGPAGATATLRLALSGQLEPRRVLVLSCNARGETRAGWLLRLWDAAWVRATEGEGATDLVKSAAPAGALVVAGRAAIPEKAVAWLRETALSCPVAIVAAKPRPRGLLGRLGANVKFIPSGPGAFDKALAFLAGATSPGRRRRAKANGSPKARRP